MRTSINCEGVGKSLSRKDWRVAKMLPSCDFWVDHTTHSIVKCYMPFQPMYGQKPIMPIEKAILSWTILPWKKDMLRDDLLALRT